MWGYGHPRGGMRREPGGGPPPHSPRAPCLLRIGTGPGRGRPSRKCQAQAGAGGLDRRGWRVANERSWMTIRGVLNVREGTVSPAPRHWVCSLSFVCLSVCRPTLPGPRPSPAACTGGGPRGFCVGRRRPLVCLPPALVARPGRAPAVSEPVTLPSHLERWHFKSTTGAGARVGGPAGARAERGGGRGLSETAAPTSAARR